MADPHGFLKTRNRELAAKRPVPIRLMDFREVLDIANPAMVQRQSSRCMDCGVAFCHQGCPLGNLIPEWNDLVARGREREALDRLHSTNNFPEFTGRACPAPCESACVLGINQPAVTIKQIENSIIDQGFLNGWVVPRPPERLTGKTVAIVGSGPAGLAAAQQLTRVGHTVAVYERADQPGGLLRYGIPDFKLEKALVDRRIEQMRQEGTRFRTGIEIGTDITWSELRRRYDAIIVATGATVPKPLELPGRNLSGVHYAMDYLTSENYAQHLQRVASSAEAHQELHQGVSSEDNATGRTAHIEATAPRPHAGGKHVVVIGGGDTGADCIGTAHRQGARTVTNLAIGSMPPADRPAHQPWPVHPNIFEIQSSHEEGGERRYLASTIEFVADDSGQVSGLRVAETGFTEEGRVALPGTEQVIAADLVLIAMGFSSSEPIDDPQLSLTQNENGTLLRASDYSTALPGVFVAGDAGRGQSLIVWAIAEGRSVAASVDTYLTGGTVLASPVNARDRAFV